MRVVAVRGWAISGFLALQHALNCILAAPANSQGCGPLPEKIAMFPTPTSSVNTKLTKVFCFGNCKDDRPIGQAIATGAALSLVEGMGFALAMYARQVASDKEEKRKELLQIMGCKPAMFYASYVVLYAVQVSVYAAAVSALTASWFEHTGFMTLWLLVSLWGIVGLVFTSAAVSCFQTATMATTAAIFAYILPFLLFMALDDLTAAAGQAVVCLFPPMIFGYPLSWWPVSRAISFMLGP